MEFEKISSRSNEKIKLFQHLSQSASFRRETGLFALEGARICSDAAITGIEIKTAFFTVEALRKYPEYADAVIKKAEQCFEITHDLCGRISDTRGPQGIFCICVQRKNFDEQNLCENGTYIALDNMQDPSNLGAVLRTAEAFGLSGVLVGGGCDIYNPKALRAAMGSSLRISVLTTSNLPSLLIFASKKGMLTVASTPDSSAVCVKDMPKRDGIVCVIGNEGSGISQEVKDVCDMQITIPMRGRAESLNAAAAAAVLMWELTK
ncbi:MAG: RNA methyltransferase [Clostridia bacterium]|nr:RNA methyltransferase [Clostridia bacterium]